MPEIIKLNHSPEAVKRVLSVLEAVEYRWTISDVLAQDEAWLDDLMLMRGVGEKYKRIRAAEQGEEENG